MYGWRELNINKRVLPVVDKHGRLIKNSMKLQIFFAYAPTRKDVRFRVNFDLGIVYINRYTVSIFFPIYTQYIVSNTCTIYLHVIHNDCFQLLFIYGRNCLSENSSRLTYWFAHDCVYTSFFFCDHNITCNSCVNENRPSTQSLLPIPNKSSLWPPEIFNRRIIDNAKKYST